MAVAFPRALVVLPLLSHVTMGMLPPQPLISLGFSQHCPSGLALVGQEGPLDLGGLNRERRNLQPRRKQPFGCMRPFQLSTSACVGNRNDTETLGMLGGGVLAGNSSERTCLGLADEVSSPSPAQSDFS